MTILVNRSNFAFFRLFFEKHLSSQYFKDLYLVQHTKIVRRDELYKLVAKNRGPKAFLVENLAIFLKEVDFFQKSKIFKIQVFDLKLTLPLEITSDSCSTHPETVVGYLSGRPGRWLHSLSYRWTHVPKNIPSVASMPKLDPSNLILSKGLNKLHFIRVKNYSRKIH